MIGAVRAAAVADVLQVGAAGAATLDFAFSFVNALNGGGTVTGEVRGLSEGPGAAISVEVLTSTTGLRIGEFVKPGASRNSFPVTGGALTSFRFFSYGRDSGAPRVTDSSLIFESADSFGTSFRAGPSRGSAPWWRQTV
jgi:hypothetical protein